VKRADVPIIPVVIDGSFKSWPRSRKLFHSHPVRVQFGPAMTVNGLSSEQILTKIGQTLRSMLQELRASKEGRQ
jgi:1-acyl-sn-glycerol-3-phosphate acyltransferase